MKNTPDQKSPHRARSWRTLLVLLAGAGVMCQMLVLAQTDSSASADAEWQKQAEFAFKEAIKRARKEPAFRKSLMKCNSAKNAVVKEGRRKFPKFEMPVEHVVVFFESETKSSETAKLQRVSGVGDNHKYHIFHLPPPDPNDASDPDLEAHLVCCYPPWEN